MPGTHVPLYDFVRDFGTNVAARRKLLGMSQMQLAERIGIGQDMLSRIESGQAAPKFRRLQDFADALHCSIASLFSSATPGEREQAEFLAALIHPLPPQWQNCVLLSAQQMVQAVKMTSDADQEASSPGSDDEDEQEEQD